MSLATHWVDGEQAGGVPLPDRGFAFGDGLFETFLYAQGRLFYPEYHYLRLQHGLKTLGVPDCMEAVKRQVDEVLVELRQMQLPQSALRLTVTRGGGPRGYAPLLAPKPRIVISVEPVAGDWHVPAKPVSTAVAGTRWSTQPALAGIKHLNRLDQVLAARERLAAGVDEMVMLDQQGSVVSVISGNIFAVVGGRIQTPLLSSCGVLGTRRQLIVDRWAPALGVEVREVAMGMDELLQAEELFYSNTLLGLCPVASIGSTKWSGHPMFAALHQVYLGENA
ncbi:MAG: aminodeoxychorismate lyase [Halioglobus sp.]